MIWIVLVGLLLAFANGANDNLKGVASLLGSGTTRYGRALAWATLTTLAGSITAILLAGELIDRFRGKGLVPEALTGDPLFLGAVAFGAGATVLIATRIGMPISTTHSLVGALVGAGFGAMGSVRFDVLAGKVLAPLLISPLIALVATAIIYRAFHFVRKRLGIEEDSCLCVGGESLEAQPVASPALAVAPSEELSIRLGSSADCMSGSNAGVLDLQAAPVLDAMHYLSGGALGFARGLNDTPKIAALLLVVPALTSEWALVAVGIAIALGGVLAARRVAHTMSFEITPMNAGQGFTTNMVSAILVLIASPLGVPVSTTHVTCGSLFGLGLATGEGKRGTMGRILAAWVITLPLAAALAWSAAYAIG